MPSPYSAAYEFPRRGDERPDPLPDNGPDWSPGSPVAKAHGCCCLSGKDHHGTGHLVAVHCPVHEVHYGLRLREPVCHCGARDCTASCPVVERGVG